MPTYNRRAFVPRAIEYFLRQDYANKELVIVDDGTDAVGDLVPNDQQIRYIRLNQHCLLGAKRNLCVETARGDLIMHWDDDDWYAPHRISYQVGELLRANAEACSLRRMLWYDLTSGKVWLYQYPENQRPWLAGNSLLYTKSFWQRSPFPKIQVGSDTRFIFSQSLDRSVALPDHTFYVGMIHAGNTSRKQLRGAYWHPWDGNLRAVMGADLDFYSQIGNGTPPVDVSGPLTKISSLEQLAEAEALPKQNAKVLEVRQYPSQVRIDPRDKSTSLPRVTVSIPFHGAPQLLRRAVDSILQQTYTHLRVIVVNDGDAPPWRWLADINDPRLTCFGLPVNRGRYFADAVVLNATDDPFFLIQDADDWSEPRRLEKLLRLLRAEHAVGAVSNQYHHTLAAHLAVRVHNIVSDLHQPLDSSFRHRAYHIGLFRTDALRAIGGYYHGFPVGSDTLLVNFLLMVGRIAGVSEPLYHRLARPDSLTHAPATGMSSRLRREVTDHLRQMYAVAFDAYTRYLAGEIEQERLCERLCEVSQQHVTPEMTRALAVESQRLRDQLACPVSSAAPAPVSPQPVQGPQSIVDSLSVQWSGWTINHPLAEKLSAYLEREQPRHILEAGSGASTVLLADYARRHQATLTSLEHDPQYYARTQQMLQERGLQEHIDLRLAPLQPYKCSDGKSYPWYSAEAPGPFDFVLLDGPPERSGRQAALFAVAPHLARDWVIWLHDGARTHEQACVELWSDYFNFSQVCDFTESKGVFYLRQAVSASDRLPTQAPPASTLGIGLLTGDRPNLVRQTMESLLKFRNGFVLQNSTLVVLVNGDDPITQAYIEQLPFVAHCIHHTGSVLPIGTATSCLVDFLTRQPGIGYVLHLEDDWVLEAPAIDWLEMAHSILDKHPQVGQVRLRHTNEKVLPYHMITRRPIQWQSHGKFLLASSAHFTFNPSLVRSRDVSLIFPCRTEREAQEHYLTASLVSAQLSPGVFRHMGAQQSRRAKMGRKA